MELWHCADARSFRPLWMLEEMQLPYRLHLLPFPPRWQQPGYLETNPLGTIPYFVDSSGPRIPGAATDPGEPRIPGAATNEDSILTESSGILHYLAERHGPTPLAVQPHEPDYALYLNYLFQSDATFTFPQTLVLRYRVLEPPEKRQPAVADAYAKWFLARMTWVETHLEDGRDWLAAGRFTAADIAVGYACLLATTLGLAQGLGPRTLAWWGRCQARDGYQRARTAQKG